jgi:hypothetical protein
VELFFKWIKQHLRIKRFFGVASRALWQWHLRHLATGMRTVEAGV